MSGFAMSYFGSGSDQTSSTEPANDDYDNLDDSYSSYQPQEDFNTRAPETEPRLEQKAPAAPRETPASVLRKRYVPPQGVDLMRECDQGRLMDQSFVVLLFNVACVTTTTAIPVEVAAVRFTLRDAPKVEKGPSELEQYHSIIEYSTRGEDGRVVEQNFLTMHWNMVHVHGILNTEGIANEMAQKHAMRRVWEELNGFIRDRDVIIGKEPTVTYRCLEKVSNANCKFPMVRPIEDVVDYMCRAYGACAEDEYFDMIDGIAVRPPDAAHFCELHKRISEKGNYRCVLAEAHEVVKTLLKIMESVSQSGRYGMSRLQPQQPPQRPYPDRRGPRPYYY